MSWITSYYSYHQNKKNVYLSILSLGVLLFLSYCHNIEQLQYAERLPIGLEKVIQMVSSETLKQFYQKWYHLQNMAVIAVGDFPGTKVGLS